MSAKAPSASTSNGVAAAAVSTRRAPVQARSKQRIEDILGITADLVDELGPNEVTTTLIAERLGISVGSIYNYFTDRSAVFDAIVARSISAHFEMSMATRAKMLPSGPITPDEWFASSFAVIDSLADAYRTEPGFRTLWFSQHLSPAMTESMQRTDEAQARKVLADLGPVGLVLDCSSPLDAMRMYVGLIDKGLDLAFRNNPRGSRKIIAETKQVVRSYLGAYLRAAPPTRPTRR